jgi:hypothetical protein
VKENDLNAREKSGDGADILNAAEMKESAAAAWRCRHGIVGKLRKPNKMQFALQSRTYMPTASLIVLQGGS